jgi:small-conductance mechanosensitive channel
MNFVQFETAVRTAFANIVTTARASVPGLLGAAALLLVGWGLAWLLQAWSTRLLHRLDPFVRDSQIEGLLHRAGVRRPVAEALGRLVFWMVLLFFVTAATEALGLPVLAAWVAGLAYFVPRIAVALLIFLAGWFAAAVVRNAVLAGATTAGIVYGPALAQMARIATVLVAALIAVNALGIDVTILTMSVTVALGAVLGSFGLAFGLGARTTVSNIVGAHYLRQVARVGQTIRLGDVQGEIVAITATAVVLKHAEGRIIVPAGQFNEAISTLLA